MRTQQKETAHTPTQISYDTIILQLLYENTVKMYIVYDLLSLQCR